MMKMRMKNIQRACNENNPDMIMYLIKYRIKGDKIMAKGKIADKDFIIDKIVEAIAERKCITFIANKQLTKFIEIYLDEYIMKFTFNCIKGIFDENDFDDKGLVLTDENVIIVDASNCNDYIYEIYPARSAWNKIIPIECEEIYIISNHPVKDYVNVLALDKNLIYEFDYESLKKTKEPKKKASSKKVLDYCDCKEAKKKIREAKSVVKRTLMDRFDEADRDPIFDFDNIAKKGRKEDVEFFVIIQDAFYKLLDCNDGQSFVNGLVEFAQKFEELGIDKFLNTMVAIRADEKLRK